MMRGYFRRIGFLVISYLFALLILGIARILFFILNKAHFNDISTSDFASVLFYGLRFDVITATIINALFIFLVAFPVSFFKYRGFRTLLKIVFISTNSLALALNMIDMAYFPFTLRRSTVEIFSFFFQKNDTGTLLILFIKELWYMFLIFFLFLFVMSWLYKIIEKKLINIYTPEVNNTNSLAVKSLLLLFITALSVFSIRGGTQPVPISIIDAASFVKPAYVPLVLNTPFCIIKSFDLPSLEEKKYMSEAEAVTLINPIKKYNYADSAFRKLNVVIIIVESLSKEYTKLGKRKSYTPFLDSLMDNSLIYSNAFSNGKRSIEGIPAIVASMPSLQCDYISTVYSNDKITSLANVLKTKGYYASFFHGGTNGTMNFNSFCATAGYNKYFGRREYKDDKDYDGNWGIWDEPFLQRMAQELNKQPQPFLSTVFTLSSHHPFDLPKQYRNKFLDGKLPINKCISYADYSLKQFFKAAQKSTWFANTLFVITADHTGDSEDLVYGNSYGNYQIPMFFYLSDNSLKGRCDIVAQQIDIMPTILDMLKYNQPFYALGNNLNDSTKNRDGFAINYHNNVYQYFSNEELLQFDGEKLLGLYNYRTDTLLANNMVNKKQISDKKIKAFIQKYNNNVINNEINIK